MDKKVIVLKDYISVPVLLNIHNNLNWVESKDLKRIGATTTA